MSTAHADQVLVWATVVGGIGAWVASLLAVWRTRAGGKAGETQVRELLEQLIEDFIELAALGPGHPEWFLDPARRERELRLVALHADLADDTLRQQVAVCRAAYLDCWALSSAHPPESVETDLFEMTRRGSAAAASVLGRVGATRP